MMSKPSLSDGEMERNIQEIIFVHPCVLKHVIMKYKSRNPQSIMASIKWSNPRRIIRTAIILRLSETNDRDPGLDTKSGHKVDSSECNGCWSEGRWLTCYIFILSTLV